MAAEVTPPQAEHAGGNPGGSECPACGTAIGPRDDAVWGEAYVPYRVQGSNGPETVYRPLIPTRIHRACASWDDPNYRIVDISG